MIKNTAFNKDRTEVREYQTPTSGVFFGVKKVLYDKRSKFQKIEIIENKEYGRVLLLDGLVQTTEKDEFFYHEMLVHPAMASHKRPKKVLIIGGGDGGALREALRYPVERAWLCEIDGQVIEACRKHFDWLKPAFKDGRAELVIGDGNMFIRKTKEKFDVILVDSSDPVGPSTILHSRVFYEKLKTHLAPGGIVAAQAGSQILHLEEHREKSLFLKKLFKHASFYLGPVPTYPVGMWCYNFLSDSVDPLAKRQLRVPGGLKYYNPGIHRAAFALPNFFVDKIG
ncbi:MAG: polyamine aminopropyltransferase [Candidatus Aminicenantes bacterium]|nr:polyamine aminopropyltransferase [Candidatus Aminicenantes bacterium]